MSWDAPGRRVNMVLAVLGSEDIDNPVLAAADQDNIIKLVLTLYSIDGSNLRADPVDAGERKHDKLSQSHPIVPL